MPRVSQEQAKLNRQRVVEVAAALFRERGLHGVGVADIMASAGLTHGGFYGQFASKDALAVEAFDSALGEDRRGALDMLSRAFSALARAESLK
jgi:TetR/AcrR family transcriptional repressor of nem operon